MTPTSRLSQADDRQGVVAVIDNNTNLDDFVLYLPDTGWDDWGCTHFDDDGVVCPFIGVENGVVPVRKKGEEYTGEALCAVHGHGGHASQQLQQISLPGLL